MKLPVPALMILLLASCSQAPAHISMREGSSSSYVASNPHIRENRRELVKDSSDDIIEVEDHSSPAPVNLSEPANITPKSIEAAPAKPSTHRVNVGDTLFSLGRQYHVKREDIIELNHLKAPYDLQVGQIVKIPEKQISAPAPVKKKTSSKPVKKTVKESKGTDKGQFTWPVKGKILRAYGRVKEGEYNDGINISAPAGTDVKAAEDGTVMYVGNELKGYGNLVIIQHKDDWTSTYAHNKAILVNKGETVRRGQVIARVGNTGRVARPQLYFSLRKGKDTVNPARYL